MPRPKDADSAKTHEAIIAAARAILAEEPELPSLREVARRAGVSAGTIQYYFTSKEELLEACLDDYYVMLSQLAMEHISALQPGADPGPTIEAAVRAFFRFLRDNRSLLALRLATNAQRGELHPRRQGEFMGDMLAAIVSQAAALLQVSAFDAQLSIQVIATMASRFALLSDSEIHALTKLEGQPARDAIEDFVARAGRRLIRPLDG